MNGASPKFSRRAMTPLPSVATFRRTHSSVSCASSQFMANKRMLLESAFTLGLLSMTNSVKHSASFTPKPPNLEGSEVSTLREERDSYSCMSEKAPIRVPFRKLWAQLSSHPRRQRQRRLSARQDSYVTSCGVL